jgi:sulfur-carrier protein
MIRVRIPVHLRRLAGIAGELNLTVDEPVNIAAVLDVIEREYPALRGTLRDRDTRVRRPFIRFFVCESDWSHEPTDRPLPDEIVSGREPLLIIGAMAGG